MQSYKAGVSHQYNLRTQRGNDIYPVSAVLGISVKNYGITLTLDRYFVSFLLLDIDDLSLQLLNKVTEGCGKDKLRFF